METNPHLLKHADKLQPYILQGVVATGKQLGSGAFGSIIELKLYGAVCAGKKIHDALVHPGNEKMQRIIDKFVFECELMSKMRHPNIVSFYGLCFIDKSASPVLVMERLDQSLEDYLERVQEKDMPFSIQISILYDIARGLVFLHTYDPVIVHRDLTARNVLLTQSLQAKIADLGNSRIINHGVLSRSLSQAPGTLLYMPPEALEFKPTYDASIDLFSFGHMALYLLGHTFPGHLLPATYPDPQHPGVLRARNEVERRHKYFEKLKATEMVPFSLTDLIIACLDNLPANRPTSKEVSQVLSRICEDKFELMKEQRRIDRGSIRRPSVLITRILEGKPYRLGLLKASTWMKGQTWKMYMFQLTNKALAYYKQIDIKGERPRQELSLEEITSVSTIDDDPQFQFQVNARQNKKDIVWKLKAETEEERECWVKAIAKNSHITSVDLSSDYEKMASPIDEYIEMNVQQQEEKMALQQQDLQQYQYLHGQDPPAAYSSLGQVKKKRHYAQATTKDTSASQQQQGLEEYQLLHGRDPPAAYCDLDQPKGKQPEQFTWSQEHEMAMNDMDVSKRGKDHRRTSVKQQNVENAQGYSSVNNDQSIAHPMEDVDFQLPSSGAHRPRLGDLSQDQLALVVKLLQMNLSSRKDSSGGFLAVENPRVQRSKSDASAHLSKRKALYENIGEVSWSEANEGESRPPFPVKSYSMKRTSGSANSREKHKQTIESLLQQSSTDDLLVTEDDTEYEVTTGARRPDWAKASTSVGSTSSIQPDKQLDTLYISKERLYAWQCIAEGEFGKIYRAKLRNFQREKSIEVAVKYLKKCESEKEKKNFEREMAISADPKMTHPNIVQVYGLVREESMIVMEYLPLGDLKTFLIKYQCPLSKLVKYMLDVALGMHFISDHGLVHRDLAARNVLLGPGEICKVSDFGLLREIPDDENYYIQTSSSKCPIRWMAPESFSDRKFSSASDVWSFGILQWEMFKPKAIPYEDCSNLQVVAKVSQSVTPSIPENCPPQIAKIMKACWHTVPSKRPSFQLIAHRLTEINYGIH